MQFITTTELRTKSTELVATLQKGEAVTLIHRSRIVGSIQPAQLEEKVIPSAESLKGSLTTLKPSSPLSAKEREKRYRAHMTEKYGKNLS